MSNFTISKQTNMGVIAETKIKKIVKHDNMSLSAHFPSGASLRFAIGRSGDKLDLNFSNDPKILKEQGKILIKWLDYREKENNEQRFARLEKICMLAKSGAEFIKLLIEKTTPIVEETLIQKISISKLIELIDPFKWSNWVKCDSPLTIDEILTSSTISPDIPQEMTLIWNTESREIHAGRIHWLVLNWSDDYPIDLDFGIPQLFQSTDILLDGHHRLMAAIILKKEFINARCCGAVSEIEKYLKTKQTKQ